MTQFVHLHVHTQYSILDGQASIQRLVDKAMNDGQPGIDDTAAEVRALRAQGIRVAAVFMGENTSVPAANAIYGRDLARIRRIDQLAAAAGRLIQDEIRELSG